LDLKTQNEHFFIFFIGGWARSSQASLLVGGPVGHKQIQPVRES